MQDSLTETYTFCLHQFIIIMLFCFSAKCLRASVFVLGFFFFFACHLSQNTELAYILYNDQKPPVDFSDRWVDNSGSRRGHTKGEHQYLQSPHGLQEIWLYIQIQQIWASALYVLNQASVYALCC